MSSRLSLRISDGQTNAPPMPPVCTRSASARQGQAAGGDGKLRSSMNGRVVAVAVAVGERVIAGQALVTLEAMKMEHVHAAPLAGLVIALHVATGEQVPANRVLVEIEAESPLPA